jgi:hypothetical protein
MAWEANMTVRGTLPCELKSKDDAIDLIWSVISLRKVANNGVYSLSSWTHSIIQLIKSDGGPLNKFFL